MSMKTFKYTCKYDTCMYLVHVLTGCVQGLFCFGLRSTQMFIFYLRKCAQLNRFSSSCSFQIRGFPTIKIFRKGDEPEDYQGGRSRGDIIARALDLFSDNAPPPELVEVSELLDSAALAASAFYTLASLTILRSDRQRRRSEEDVRRQSAVCHRRPASHPGHR